MKKFFKNLNQKYNLSVPISFIILTLFFIIFTPNHIFIDPRNLASIFKLLPDLGIVTLGIGVLMICGEFDLSISSIIPLSSFIFAKSLVAGINPVVALIIVLIVGAVIGFINGFIVVKTGLSSFIITLSTMLILQGILLIISQVSMVAVSDYINPFFKNMFIGKIGAIPVQLVWFIVLAIIFGLFLHFHKFGNWVFSVGNSKETARAMGINTNMVKIICYMIVGVLSAVVAVQQAIRVGQFDASQGKDYGLLAVSAVAVGGISLNGGKGSILNIVLGLLIIKFLSNGLIMMQVPVYGINSFIGAAIIFFVILNNALERRIE